MPGSVSPDFGILSHSLLGWLLSLSLGEKAVPSRFGMGLMAFKGSRSAPSSPACIPSFLSSKPVSLPSSLRPLEMALFAQVLGGGRA